jgi:hypothetical protein
VAHPWDFSDEEFKAIAALQRGSPAPSPADRVWASLVTIGMVWIDESSEPPVVRLTAIGRNYDAS